MARFGFWATLSAALLLTMSVDPAMGGKPSKPPPTVDTGTIYYGNNGYICSMDPDGSNKTVLSLTGGGPSIALHGGKRWFLRPLPIAGETYPSGNERQEIFAVTDEGDEVQITNAFDLEPSYNAAKQQWATEAGVADGKISYLGIRWATDQDGEWILDGSGEPVIAESGLFTLALDWSAILGNSWSPGDPACRAIDLTLCDDEWGIYFPVNTKYDWSPDGTKVVYFDSWDSTAALRVAPVDGSSAPVTIVSSACYDPRWSSGDLIVFSTGAIKTVRSDGTGMTTIVPAPTKRYLSLAGATWSPNGTHLVYSLEKHDPSDWNHTFYRITATGGDKTPIYSDTAGGLFRWRQ